LINPIIKKIKLINDPKNPKKNNSGGEIGLKNINKNIPKTTTFKIKERPVGFFFFMIYLNTHIIYFYPLSFVLRNSHLFL